MAFRLSGVVRHSLRTVGYGLLGMFITLIVVFLLKMNDLPDLSIWHHAELDEEFTVDSGVSTFRDYLALEDRLFKQLDDLVVATVVSDETTQINRFSRGSLSDPARWPQNWNRSYEMPVSSPRAVVLLLHGMTDSPYSLHSFAESLHQSGAYVIGLRVPGHGTAPSGLLRVTWQDMAAAVKLAMHHAHEQAHGQPVYIVGYSNGGALAVNYTLDAVADPALPRVNRLVLLSPEIGVSRAAAFAVWQARLGVLLGQEKLSWTGLLPEYDPYKYGSFAVNAADVAWKLTDQIQQQITALGEQDKLAGVPPILAFSSIVDATVLAPDLIEQLFDRLPMGGHELVLFDINRVAQLEPILNFNPGRMLAALQANPGKTFTLSFVINKDVDTLEALLASQQAGANNTTTTDLGLSWPRGVYSLSHVALPFPPDDPLYGGENRRQSPGVHLGDLALRGERDVLLVPAAEMLRMRWNPFYSFVEQKVLEFLGLGVAAAATQAEADAASSSNG
jgi:alpha-beta hydrolase superfamily lysophospholipase